VGLLAASLLAPVVPITSVAASPGLFQPWQAISIPSEPDAVAIGDVSGDGRPDLVATTGYDVDPAHDFHLIVLVQGADGLLQPPVWYATAGTYPNRPGSIDIGDINGDGRPDVVIGIDRLGIQLFPGQSDGTLGAPSFVAHVDSTRIRIAPLDKSNRDQVAGIGWDSGSITTFADTGAGLVAARTYPVQHEGWDDLEIGDVTGDGANDLVVMSGQGFVPNVSVLAAQPNGTFGAAAEYSIGGDQLTNGIGLGDVTGDGRTDVIASYGGNQPSSHLAILAQTAGGGLAAPASLASYDIPEPVEVADVDLDGRSDVVTLHGGWLKAGIYRGLPGGGLAAESLEDIPYASHYSVHGLALGDLNSDGFPDIVAADDNNGLVILSNRAVFQPSVPDAPTLTQALAGDRRVTLAWLPPAVDGGAAITSYTATASPGGASCTIGGSGCSISGLTNNGTYTFTVRATNAAGSGPASNALSATPGVAPTAPQSLAASPNLAAGIGLTWGAPVSPGSTAVTAYRIYRGLPGGSVGLLATVGNVTSYTDGAVVNGGQYVYQVAAVNGFGEGPRTAGLTTQRGTAPSAPQSVTASVGGPGITIRWSAPASNGGAIVSGFRLYRRTPTGSVSVVANPSPTTFSYLDKNLAKKTAYTYWLTAVNVLGEGARSNEVTVTSR
jgi:hypothetical protein